MEWVRQRKLPACEAIQYQGRPCHSMESLWNALHGTYNAASGRPCQVAVLDEIPELQTREWAPFSSFELREALMACAKNSSPGPDHVTWTHLKVILADPHCLQLAVALANACLRVGHWPSHFKESTSVIIPKPGKPSYSAPKAFRPIVLLNTFGKLVEKVLSNRIQFDGVKYGIFHANQLGGSGKGPPRMLGCSSLILSRRGGLKGLKTSVIAFDIAQFFPSLKP